MKTLAEINAERQEIINAGIENIGQKGIRGKVYTANDLSAMSDGILPAKNIQASLDRASREVLKPRPCRRYGDYYLYGELSIKPVKATNTLTYKVYDGNGELVDEFTRNKILVKAMLS